MSDPALYNFTGLRNHISSRTTWTSHHIQLNVGGDTLYELGGNRQRRTKPLREKYQWMVCAYCSNGMELLRRIRHHVVHPATSFLYSSCQIHQVAAISLCFFHVRKEKKRGPTRKGRKEERWGAWTWCVDTFYWSWQGRDMLERLLVVLFWARDEGSWSLLCPCVKCNENSVVTSACIWMEVLCWKALLFEVTLGVLKMAR